MTAPTPAVPDLLTRLEQLRAAATERTRIPAPDSGEPVTADELSTLVVDALWTDDSYPEYSQDDVLRAYRLGAEDQRFLVSELVLAFPSLVSALRAVAELAEGWITEAQQLGVATDLHFAGVMVRAVLTAALDPAHDDERQDRG